MKRLKIVLLILLVVGGSIFLYFQFSHSPKHKMSMTSFLGEQTVMYYQSSNDVTQKMNHLHQTRSTSRNNEIEWFANLPGLNRDVHQTGTIVSWYLKRQNILSPVYWFFPHKNYELTEDSLLTLDRVGDFFSVKGRDEKLFLYQANNYIAAGTDGEIMEMIASYELQTDEQIHNLSQYSIKGNIQQFQQYIQGILPELKCLHIPGNTYHLSYRKWADQIFFNLEMDSIYLQCPANREPNANFTLPRSTIFAFKRQYNNASCLIKSLTKDQKNQLWNMEDRYQFKLSNIMDAWFGGAWTIMQCRFQGKSSCIAAMKLQSNAAPFAASNRFFSNFETISSTVQGTTKQYTIARMLPGELGNLLFIRSGEQNRLYVTQLGDHLYFAREKSSLKLLLNELTNQKTIGALGSYTQSPFRFFMRLPDNISKSAFEFDSLHEKTNKNTVRAFVYGEAIPQQEALYCQGKIIKPAQN